jgi:hypothetical protein
VGWRLRQTPYNLICAWLGLGQGGGLESAAPWNSLNLMAGDAHFLARGLPIHVCISMDKADKQKEGPGGMGKENPNGGSEAGGRGRQLLWTCFNDGAGNYIDPDWKWWSCWRCGTTYFADGTMTTPKGV